MGEPLLSGRGVLQPALGQYVVLHTQLAARFRPTLLPPPTCCLQGDGRYRGQGGGGKGRVDRGQLAGEP